LPSGYAGQRRATKENSGCPAAAAVFQAIEKITALR
jgi:hypothetical protein